MYLELYSFFFKFSNLISSKLTYSIMLVSGVDLYFYRINSITTCKSFFQCRTGSQLRESFLLGSETTDQVSGLRCCVFQTVRRKRKQTIPVLNKSSKPKAT